MDPTRPEARLESCDMDHMTEQSWRSPPSTPGVGVLRGWAGRRAALYAKAGDDFGTEADIEAESSERFDVVAFEPRVHDEAVHEDPGSYPDADVGVIGRERVADVV